MAEEQVLHDPEQATHPLLESKYCPAGQSMGLKTILLQVPKLSL